MDMTKEEFLVWLQSEFGGWVNERPRKKLSWLLSLREFAEGEIATRMNSKSNKPFGYGAGD